jgi:hypothetical protein
MANYDYGRDHLAGLGVGWQGIAGYARYQVNKWWAIAGNLRTNRNSVAFGVLYAFTS